MNTKTVLTDEEIANMPDDEFMNFSVMPASPPREKETQKEDEEVLDETTTTTSDEEEEDDPEDGAAPAGADEGDEGEDEEEADDDDTNDDDDDQEGAEEEETADLANVQNPDPLGDDDDSGEKPKKKKDELKDKDDPDAKAGDGEDEFDYKAAYLQIMAPFKANGEEIKLGSPQELIQLAQMGANYTRKMQALQPHLKVVKMLENNGVLDAEKLSFLIDLDKRDPAAIQKLLKDSGIDPLDIDTNAETTYKPTDRSVSDDEWLFTSTLEDVSMKAAGRELITSINTNWDRQSKDALWSDPNILRVLSEQKESGIYDQIASEITRRQTLGQLQGVAYLAAYQQVGQEMTQQGKLATKTKGADQGENTSPQQKQPSPRVVEKRTRKPRATVTDNDRARAASSPTGQPSGKKGKLDFNPLSMTDEEFEKQVALGKF